MGRMLEALMKKSPGQPETGIANPRLEDLPAPGKTPCPEPVPSEEPAEPAEPAAGEEYQFIEVGGPEKKVEGSPAVLAVPVPPSRGVAPAVPSPRPVLTASPLTPPPLTVAFEPWPATGLSCQCVAPEVISFHQPDHPVSRQYRALLSQLQEGVSGDLPPILLLLGARPKAGTTTVSLNLAFAGAETEKTRLVLVDAHVRRPALAERLGLPVATPGLAEVLAGKVALESALQKTIHPSLQVLASGGLHPPLSHDFDGAGPEALAWLFGRLRQRFDLILVDGPALGDSGELSPLASRANAIYLVLHQDEKKPAEMQAWFQKISAMGGRLGGLLHTQVAK